jgi:hypothetical protein
LVLARHLFAGDLAAAVESFEGIALVAPSFAAGRGLEPYVMYT